MEYEEAIAYMKESTSVIDWNGRREVIKKENGGVMPENLIGPIDCRGLINKVLNTNIKTNEQEEKSV